MKTEFEQWIEKMKSRDYEIYKDGRCPKCGERAVVMHKISVLHGKCSTCNWTTCGFGGPNVMSWEQAVAKQRREEAEAKQSRIESEA